MRVLLLDGDDAGTTTLALARGLASGGLTVDVVLGGERDERTCELLWNGKAPDEGLLTVYQVKCARTGRAGPPGAALVCLRGMLPLTRRRLREEHYDVVHLFHSLPTSAMLPLLDLRGVPLVLSIRGPRLPDRWAARPFLRWLWRRADRVVARTDSLDQGARRIGSGLRCSVIPDGVDLARFRPPLRRRPSRRLRCLSVAPLEEGQGLADLIRAIGMLERNRFELEIIGLGPEEQSLRELAAALGVGDRVLFSGTLDRVLWPGRYRAADLFTLACREEPPGNVLAEALASGLPVVASNVGGTPELVRHGRNGLLVPPGNPLAIAAAIRHLADSPDLRAEMSRRNRAEAETTLSWERVSARYLSIYHGVQRRVPARPGLTELPTSTW